MITNDIPFKVSKYVKMALQLYVELIMISLECVVRLILLIVSLIGMNKQNFQLVYWPSQESGLTGKGNI